MNTTQALQPQAEQAEQDEPGLFPLIEVELKGQLLFEQLINTLDRKYHIPYKLLKADIEYMGKANYGTLLLHLKGSKKDNGIALRYFDQNKLKNTLKGYA